MEAPMLIIHNTNTVPLFTIMVIQQQQLNIVAWHRQDLCYPGRAQQALLEWEGAEVTITVAMAMESK